jgi:hypothetical protein
MKKDSTDITIVLDKSGSMDHIRKDTIGGVNRFIEDQRKVPGAAAITISLFDHNYERPIVARNIHEAPLLDEKTYRPDGNTCLFGAVGTAIRETGERLEKLPESERPEHVIFLIVTDGEENSSHQHEWSQKHTADSIKKAIELQSGTYNWKFVYIGANQDAITNAARMGIHAGQALNYTANKQGTSQLYGSLSANVGAVRSRQASNLDWSAKQRKEQDAAKLTS